MSYKRHIVHFSFIYALAICYSTNLSWMFLDVPFSPVCPFFSCQMQTFIFIWSFKDAFPLSLLERVVRQKSCLSLFHACIFCLFLFCSFTHFWTTNGDCPDACSFTNKENFQSLQCKQPVYCSRLTEKPRDFTTLPWQTFSYMKMTLAKQYTLPAECSLLRGIKFSDKIRESLLFIYTTKRSNDTEWYK